MAKRVILVAVLVAFVVCAAAMAQQMRGPDRSAVGAVSVKSTSMGSVRFSMAPVIPSHINYQGYLTDLAGNPVNDTLNMAFRIYNQPAGGSELWSESQDVQIENGIFNVVLGASVPVPDSIFTPGGTRWLELAIGVQTMSPRTEITSVGYAYRSLEADSAAYADNADAVDGFGASVAPAASDLFPLSYADLAYVNEGQADAIDSTMILDGTITRVDVEPAFKAPYADTADWARAVASNWTIAGNVLHPSGSYGLAMRSYNVLLGESTHTHVNFGIACTTGSSTSDYLYCTVAGGSHNCAYGEGTTVGGGMANWAYLDGATVGGGNSNVAWGNDATVGGGSQNRAGGNDAVVGGGYMNTASGYNSAVGGGRMNLASGSYATVAGGEYDTAAGDFSFAGGWGVKVALSADTTFAFGKGFTTTTANAAVFHSSTATFKMGIGVANPTYPLHMGSGAYCSAGGVWTNGSSREYKKNIVELTREEATEALSELNPVTFEYKRNPGDRCAGFIAEDVPDLVATPDRKGLSPMDIVAVLTKVVQAQQQEIEELKSEVEKLKR